MMPEVVEMKKNGVNVSVMVFDKVRMRDVKTCSNKKRFPTHLVLFCSYFAIHDHVNGGGSGELILRNEDVVTIRS